MNKKNGRSSGYRSGNNFNNKAHRRSGRNKPRNFRNSNARHRKNRHNYQNAGKNRYAKNLDISAFINKETASPAKAEKEFSPRHAFADFAIDQKLKNAILAKGYKAPTPIQDRIIPHILEGKDVVGIANTGTGKTAAFLIPLINKVIADKKEQVIVVTPTRELANQINQELKKFTSEIGIYSVCCVGGTSIAPQIRALAHDNSFIIGTPGRLKDLIERKKINLSKISTIVLDEADVMLDMGFIADMRYLVSRMPANRHTLFFSATMSRDIEKLIKDFLRDPVSVSVKTGNTAAGIEQDVVKADTGQEKSNKLESMLSQPDFHKVLIFGRTKRGVERLSQDLQSKGFKADSIHGNKNYNQRQRTLKSFKNDRIKVLVATDVASRGLDIPSVSHVINYDMPNTYEDYIHRIGRTGRWGKKGKALTFV